MAIPDARVKAYENLFKSHRDAGPISLFQDVPRYQSRKGFGDSLRVLVRRIHPNAHNVGRSALSAMYDAHEQVASFKDSLTSAVRPATNAAMHGPLSQIEKEQHRSGRKRCRKHKAVYKGLTATRSMPNFKNF